MTVTKTLPITLNKDTTEEIKEEEEDDDEKIEEP